MFNFDKTELYKPISENVFHGNNKLIIHHEDGLQLAVINLLTQYKSSLLPKKSKNIFMHDNYRIVEYTFTGKVKFIKDLNDLSETGLRKVLKRILYGLYELNKIGLVIKNFNFIVDKKSLRV